MERKKRRKKVHKEINRGVVEAGAGCVLPGVYKGERSPDLWIRPRSLKEFCNTVGMGSSA